MPNKTVKQISTSMATFSSFKRGIGAHMLIRTPQEQTEVVDEESLDVFSFSPTSYADVKIKKS